MTYDDMYKLRRQWGLDPYHELYGWLMKPEPGFVGHDMLKVVVIRMRDNWAWSAALGSHVRVDGVLQRMEESFSYDLWLEPADHNSDDWEIGGYDQLKAAMIRGLEDCEMRP